MVRRSLWAAVGLAVTLGLGRLAWRLMAFFRSNGVLTSGDARRRYLLHVPPGLSGERAVPLVVVIHGFMQSPAHQRDMTRWDDVADVEGFITVYPMGTGLPLRWMAHEPSSASDETRAHVGFVRELVEDLCERYPVDRDRIYACGMSNGGGLTMVLAYELPEVFAAVGSVAGLYTYPLPEDEGRAVPLIAFHGELDRIVPIEGHPRRMGYPVPAVADLMEAYAARCGCSARAEARVSDAVTRVSYTGGRDGSEVVWYRIANGGHTWPGGVPLPEYITGPTSHDVDATRLMWDFFRRHARVRVGTRG